MSNERGVSAQELPENQDPGVAYTYDEATGKRIPWKTEDAEPPAKRRGRPSKTQEEVADEPAAGEGEGE